MADEAPSWDALLYRLRHEADQPPRAYSSTVPARMSRGLFSRIRRAEIGHHHHVAGPYLVRYAQEAAFREDHRRMSNGEHFRSVIGLVVKNKPSVDFCGHWQRAKTG